MENTSFAVVRVAKSRSHESTILRGKQRVRLFNFHSNFEKSEISVRFFRLDNVFHWFSLLSWKGVSTEKVSERSLSGVVLSFSQR